MKRIEANNLIEEIALPILHFRCLRKTSLSVLEWSRSYENHRKSRISHRKVFYENWCWKISLNTTMKLSWSCSQNLWKYQWRNYWNKDFLQRHFSRILTTKCELKLDCKERLVFYRYSTLTAWHLNLLCHFQRKLHQNFTKLINLAKMNI